MSERRAGRRGAEADAYDNVDAQIGEVRLWDRDWTVRLRARIGEEAYHRGHDDEIIPLTQRRGTRTYVLGHPYLLQPDVRLNVRAVSVAKN